MNKIVLILIAIVFCSCDYKVVPDGKDDTGYENTGYYVLVNECVKSHFVEERRFTGKIWIRREVEVCDEYIEVKRYLDISEVRK